MFAQSGLRFDRDFYNRVYFGRGVVFQFYTNQPEQNIRMDGTANTQVPPQENSREVTGYKQGPMEKLLSKALWKVTRAALRGIGVQIPEPPQNLDKYMDLEISITEAASGGEKKISFKRDKKKTNLMVKIPAGVTTGTRIRLKGMGLSQNSRTGDLYLTVKVKDR
jgi:hypothetical protein